MGNQKNSFPLHQQQISCSVLDFHLWETKKICGYHGYQSSKQACSTICKDSLAFMYGPTQARCGNSWCLCYCAASDGCNWKYYNPNFDIYRNWILSWPWFKCVNKDKWFIHVIIFWRILSAIWWQWTKHTRKSYSEMIDMRHRMYHHQTITLIVTSYVSLTKWGRGQYSK